MKMEYIEGLPKGAGRTYEDAARLGLIDAPIRALVAAINAEPRIVSTLACCAGHSSLGRYYRPPYVVFAAPVSAAAQFDAQLRDADSSPRHGLRLIWEVTGRFDDGRLYFTLSPNNLSRYWFVPRHWIAGDFRILEGLVPKLLAAAREDNL